MFTWICPQCGREVPPSYAECPQCAENRAKAAAPRQQPVPQPSAAAVQPAQPPNAHPQAPPPTPLMEAPSNWAPPQQPYPPPPQQQEVYYIGNNNSKKRMPPWLGAVLAIAVLGGGFFALYKYVGSRNGTAGATSLPAVQTSGDVAIAGHPFRKHLEVAALRLIESGNKTMLRFSVVNHSAADLPGVGLRITLTTTAATPEEPPLAVFDAKVGDLAAYATKDLELEIKTGKRVYELPDWQFLKTTFEITAPAK